MEKEQMSIMDRWKADAEMYEKKAEKQENSYKKADSTANNSSNNDAKLKEDYKRVDHSK